VDGRLYDLGSACRDDQKTQADARHGFGLKFAAGAKYILWRVENIALAREVWRKD
jgi:hypothetical protein